MKTRILLLISVLFITFSCKDDYDDVLPNINGNYIGIFERNGEEVAVELNFQNGGFSGESTLERFPAICNGNYSLFSINSINFNNKCVWTADFDWTLILNGDWNYELNGNLLVLTKENGDKYTLTRQ